MSARLIQIFWPLRTIAVAVAARGRGEVAPASVPTPGSVSAERRELLAAGLGHEPALPLLLGPPLEQRQRVEPDVDALDDPERRVAALELLAQQREARCSPCPRRRTASGIGAPRKPSAPILSKTSRWTSPRSSHSRMWGSDLGLDEVAGGLLDEPVLVGQAEVDGHAAFDASAGTGVELHWPRRPDAAPQPILGPRIARILGAMDTVDRLRPTTPRSPSRTCRRSSAATSSDSWSHGEGHELYRHRRQAATSISRAASRRPSLGHRHPRVTAAIHEQVDKAHRPAPALGYMEPVGRLAELIADEMPDADRHDLLRELRLRGDRGGAQARPPGHRPARAHRVPRAASTAGRSGRQRHDARNINYRTGYEPLLPSVYISPLPERVYRDFGGDDAAGHRGCHGRPAPAAARGRSRRRASPQSSSSRSRARAAISPAPPAFLQQLRGALRRARDPAHRRRGPDGLRAAPGRCGRFEHAGIVPDVVCLAKAIANGLPLSAIVTRRELQERWGTGAHGSTFGGNPVACAAGIAVLETIREERLVENAAARGAELLAGLKSLQAEDDRIGDVRGPGPDDRRRVREGPRDQ